MAEGSGLENLSGLCRRVPARYTYAHSIGIFCASLRPIRSVVRKVRTAFRWQSRWQSDWPRAAIFLKGFCAAFVFVFFI